MLNGKCKAQNTFKWMHFTVFLSFALQFSIYFNFKILPCNNSTFLFKTMINNCRITRRHLLLATKPSRLTPVMQKAFTAEHKPNLVSNNLSWPSKIWRKLKYWSPETNPLLTRSSKLKQKKRRIGILKKTDTRRCLKASVCVCPHTQYSFSSLNYLPHQSLNSDLLIRRPTVGAILAS